VTCEVYDHKVLHAVVGWELVKGKWELNTQFERDPKTGMKKAPV